MKQKCIRLLAGSLLIAALLAGCASAGETPVPATQPALPSTDVSTPETNVTEETALQAGAQASENARLLLAERLQIQANAIRIISAEAVEWSDACLGVHQPDMMCAQVITPGYRIQLEANGQTYEVHTNETGTSVKLVETIEKSDALLTWKLEGESCQGASFTRTGIQPGCKPTVEEIPYVNAVRAKQVEDFSLIYLPFSADTIMGTVTLNGSGTRQPSALEQRRIAEWASMVQDEAAIGKIDPETGLILRWRRNGGIAGFCDEVIVYRDGSVTVTSCKSQTVAMQLSTKALEKFYGWLDGWAQFEGEQKDTATADSMTESWTFNGKGLQRASNEDQQQVRDFASQLAETARLSTAQLDSGSLENAQTALVTFFNLLSEGQYNEAAVWYGGDAEILTGYNPDVPADRLGVLFDRGCNTNGLVCMPVKQVVKTQKISPTEFHFTVQFTAVDGSVFSQGPCCGADPASNPPVTEFDYTVLWQDGRYRVQELPPYVP
jgi:hypothetical protein